MGVNDSVWGRLSAEDRREVDRLVAGGRNVRAIAVMRERARAPKPGILECVDLLDQRFTALRAQGGEDSGR